MSIAGASHFYSPHIGIRLLFRPALVQHILYHFFDIQADLHKILVQDALPFISRLERIELRQGNIAGFLFLYLPHVKVGFAKELRCFKLFRFLNIHRASRAGFRLCEVSCRLAADPSRCHIRNFRGRNKGVHILIKVDACFIPVNGHTLFDLNHLTEDVIRQPFQRFFRTSRTAYHVTHRRDDFLHSDLPVVRLKLRQFLKAECYTDLIASCRTNQSVYLVEIQGRQLIHDDAYRNILSLTGIHTGNKSIQNQSVQRTDDTLHFRVVGYQQIAGILRVTHFQVEIVTVTVEHPIAFLGCQTRSIDTQCTYHTFELLHRLVLQSGLERAEQRSNLIVCLQHLEDGLVTLIEERQDMRHIRVFTQPVGRFHDVAAFTVTHHAGRLPEFSLRILPFLRIQFLAAGIVRFTCIIHEEIDARGKEVYR